MTAAAVVFAGGGSGGHIFPGLAIAEALRHRAGDDVRCLFICSQRSIDAQILTRAHETFEPIPARPFSTRPGGLARFIASWPGAVRRARAVIRRAMHEADTIQLVAVGGFAAAPAVRAAQSLGVPVLMLNLDAVPGKVNRWIAARAQRVCTTMDVGIPSWSLIRPIVRRSAVSDDAPQDCRERFGLDRETPTLLVTGGSQGAGTINRLMIAVCESGGRALRGWQVIHQAGRDQAQPVSDAYERASVPACVRPFIENMADALRAAELAVSRAGAGSVAEARAARLPTLFIPYPHHRDQHQRRNAQPLVEIGAAALAEDQIDATRNVQTIGVMLEQLLNDAPARTSMREALEQLDPPDGAETVAAIILGL